MVIFRRDDLLAIRVLGGCDVHSRDDISRHEPSGGFRQQLTWALPDNIARELEETYFRFGNEFKHDSLLTYAQSRTPSVSGRSRQRDLCPDLRSAQAKTSPALDTFEGRATSP